MRKHVPDPEFWLKYYSEQAGIPYTPKKGGVKEGVDEQVQGQTGWRKNAVPKNEAVRDRVNGRKKNVGERNDEGIYTMAIIICI